MELGENIISTNQLVSIDFQDIINENFKYQLIFEASERISIQEFIVTKDRLMLNTLNNISSELLQFELADNTWKSEKVELPAKGSISFVSSIS